MRIQRQSEQFFTSQSDRSIQVGDFVRAVPAGQKKKQVIKVFSIDDGIVFGYLCSFTSPGDFRGKAIAYLEDCELYDPSWVGEDFHP